MNIDPADGVLFYDYIFFQKVKVDYNYFLILPSFCFTNDDQPV